MTEIIPATDASPNAIILINNCFFMLARRELGKQYIIAWRYDYEEEWNHEKD